MGELEKGDGALIVFEKVKAHSGVEGNEAVDKMAKEATKLPQENSEESVERMMPDLTKYVYMFNDKELIGKSKIASNIQTAAILVKLNNDLYGKQIVFNTNVRTVKNIMVHE